MEELLKDQLPPLDSLKCTLCNEYFNDPLTLSCMHSFCTSCILKEHDAESLEDFVAPNPTIPDQDTATVSTSTSGTTGEDHISTPLKQSNRPPQIIAPRRRLQCPTCVKVLGLEALEDPTEPFKNARLQRIVKLVHETPVLCENCKKAESEKLCSVCNVHCCQPCWELTHTARIFSSHVGKPLMHSEMTALPKCVHHAVNEQEFFVTEEEVGVCQVCLLKGDYVGAQYTLVSDVRKERQLEIEVVMEDVTVQRARVAEGREDTLLVLEDLEKNHLESITHVRANFAAIREALDKREAECLLSLDELKRAKKDVLKEQTEVCDVILRQIDDGLSNVKLVLKHSNPLEVIYQTYVIEEHLHTIGAVPNSAPRVCLQCQSDNLPCHHPAVDASLPVLLSDRVPSIVMAYAAVPSAQSVEEVASGQKSEKDVTPQATDEQKQVLKQVAAAAGSEEEYGCIVM